jgi:hypothetical protein
MNFSNGLRREMAPTVQGQVIFASFSEQLRGAVHGPFTLGDFPLFIAA